MYYTHYRNCRLCKGEGAIWQKIRNSSTCEYETHYCQCPIEGCNNGKVPELAHLPRYDYKIPCQTLKN